MDQISNTEFKEFFSALVADPAAVDTEHTPQLKTLVELYPQSGILRALLARAIQVHDQSGFQQKLKSAAVYAPDRAVLYNLINYPEKLVKYVEPLPEMFGEEGNYYEGGPNAYYGDSDKQGYNYTEGAIYEEEGAVNYFHDPEESFSPEQVLRAEDNNGPFNTVIPQQERDEVQETISYYKEPDTPIEAGPVNEYNETSPTYYDTPAYIEPVQDAQPGAYDLYDVNYTEQEGADAGLPPIPGYHKPNFEQETINGSAMAASEIDDEIYDEITGIEDIWIEPVNHRYLPEHPTAPIADSYGQLEDILAAQYGDLEGTTGSFTETAVNAYVQPETMAPPAVTGTPVNTYVQPVEPAAETRAHDFSVNDFRDRLKNAEQEAEYVEPESDEIAYEMVIDEPVKPGVKAPSVPAVAPTSREAVQVEPQFMQDDGRISKYNDDKMPYSFMWWLDKTRKEHATSHQPYAPFEPIAQEIKRPAESDELQQQYFENIFHLTSVEQLDRHTRSKRKESEIIDRFIQQDPQLKAPNTDKLDNENKAKRSSEDDDEFVSETLARIYLDQMLYPKAISTYQKLLLKFPEKSSYFVAQIKLLEKKIN